MLAGATGDPDLDEGSAGPASRVAPRLHQHPSGAELPRYPLAALALLPLHPLTSERDEARGTVEKRNGVGEAAVVGVGREM